MTLSAALSLAVAQAAQPAAQAGGDTQWMVYAIIALGMALALIVLEAFVPSGGVLGILAGICAIAGVVMFFRFDTTWGMVSMAVTLLAMPFIVAGMLWVWPNTPIGRALTLDDEQQTQNSPSAIEVLDQSADIVVGTEGKALTELRPVGACRLNGKRIDCMSQAGVIGTGTKVRVVFMDGMTIKVKAV